MRTCNNRTLTTYIIYAAKISLILFLYLLVCISTTAIRYYTSGQVPSRSLKMEFGYFMTLRFQLEGYMSPC